MDSVFVGIDIGTTGIKIVAVNQKMVVRYEKQYTYDYVTLSDGWQEISPQVWQDIVIMAMDELMNIFPCQITGIGVTGQMHTTVFLDKKGESIRPAILWNDMRTKSILPTIKQVIVEQTDVPELASAVSNGSPLANLIWLKEEEPENFARLHRVMMPVNYLNYILCGKESMDYCDASTTALFDLKQKDWAHSVFQAFGLSEKIFPAIRPATQVIGQLKRSFAKRWKQEKPVNIVTGTGDNVATVLATGGFESGQPVLSLGTSGVVVVPDYFPHYNPVGKNVLAEIFENDGTLITQGTVQSGAKVNTWWLEKILGQSDYATAQAAIDNCLLGHNQVIFIPHLTGEKTLFASPELRGAFFGLSLETTSSEMYLAVLEGLAFGMKMLFEQMSSGKKVSSIAIVGGGAKSTLWTRIFANVFQIPMKRMTSSYEAVHGAAMLAILSQNNSVTPLSQTFELIQPDTATAAAYQLKYQQYQRKMKLLVTDLE